MPYEPSEEAHLEHTIANVIFISISLQRRHHYCPKHHNASEWYITTEKHLMQYFSYNYHSGFQILDWSDDLKEGNIWIWYTQ